MAGESWKARGAAVQERNRRSRERGSAWLGKKKRRAGAANVKWQGKGFAPPALAIYRTRGAMLPKPRTPHALTAGGVTYR
jgi:hypothetical protein